MLMDEKLRNCPASIEMVEATSELNCINLGLKNVVTRAESLKHAPRRHMISQPNK